MLANYNVLRTNDVIGKWPESLENQLYPLILPDEEEEEQKRELETAKLGLIEPFKMKPVATPEVSKHSDSETKSESTK